MNMSTRIAVITPDIAPPGETWPIEARLSMLDVTKRIWETCQELVRGYVEIVHLTPFEPTPENQGAPFSQGWHLAAYVNEDGIGRGMPPNVKIKDGPILFGPVVFVHERVDGEGDTHYRDITEDDWEKIAGMISVYSLRREEVQP
jgi:hypothetical protein